MKAEPERAAEFPLGVLALALAVLETPEIVGRGRGWHPRWWCAHGGGATGHAGFLHLRGRDICFFHVLVHIVVVVRAGREIGNGVAGAPDRACYLHALLVAHHGPERRRGLFGAPVLGGAAAGDVHGPGADGGRGVGRCLVGEGRVMQAGGGARKVQTTRPARQDVGGGGKGVLVFRRRRGGRPDVGRLRRRGRRCRVLQGQLQREAAGGSRKGCTDGGGG